MSFENLIRQFFYEQRPTSTVGRDTRFEAISKAILGSKQRRNGPLPSPEQQVQIRDVLRQTQSNSVHFFIPWGSRKQNDHAPFDLLDFCALKQLEQLKDELERYAVKVQFTFRMEDYTDRFLFANDNREPSIRAQQEDYLTAFDNVASLLLPNAVIDYESAYVEWNTFDKLARRYTDDFLEVLTGRATVSRLRSIGWKGDLPEEQRDYYRRCYEHFYPQYSETQLTYQMAAYFAATLARVESRATCEPARVENTYTSILISFTNEVPGNPIKKPKVFYRSIPTRYTHQHYAPWIGKGYFSITDDNDVIPKAVGTHHNLRLEPYTFQLGNTTIQCDYLLA